MSSTAAATVTTPDRRPALVVLVLGLCGTVVSVMQTVVVPLLPDFPRLLDTTPDNASWLVTVTLLTSAVTTPIVSKLADMFGKRRMMLVSLAVLVVGSVIGALSTTLPGVIFARALQGFAPALIPIGISIMRDELPAEKIGSGVALMSATLGIGGAVGLPLAGVIYANADWHAVFWVSAAMGVVMAVAVLLVVPESSVRSRGRFDMLGAVLLSLALTALLLGISKGGAWGWTSEATLLSFLVAAVVFAAWVPWELRAGQPLVDIRTSARRPVLLTNIASLLVGFSIYANLLVTTQQLQLPRASGIGFGLSATEAGLGMLPGGLAMVLLAPLSAGVTRRYGAKVTLTTGSFLIAVGYVARVLMTETVWQIVVGAIVVSMGTAVAFAAMPILIMRFVPITETAAANGLNTLMRSVGTSTSSAAIAAVLTLTTIEYAGGELPSLLAFQEAFWLAAFASLAAGLLALALPGPVTVAAEDAVGTVRGERELRVGDEHEVVASGRVLRADRTPIRHAVVSVLREDGAQVDWGRADNDGRWSVVLPQFGRYLVVCSAEGWRPRSALLQLTGQPHEIELSERLRLSGRVCRDEAPLAGAVVVLTSHSGEAAGSAHCDEDGGFQMGLPPTGRYVLTVLDPDSGGAEAIPLVITPQQRPLEISVSD